MKTLTLRVDDDVYNMIKLASNGAKRNISNFIEYATLQYLTSSQYVDSDEYTTPKFQTPKPDLNSQKSSKYLKYFAQV